MIVESKWLAVRTDEDSLVSQQDEVPSPEMDPPDRCRKPQAAMWCGRSSAGPDLSCFGGLPRLLAAPLPLKIGTRIAICALRGMALPEEFLIMDPPTFPGEDDSGSSPFDTMWTEFARSHPRLSPPRTPSHRHVRHVRHVASAESSTMRANPCTIELRALEYVAEYDSNLMCPICHVPFIDPVVLDCDHTFCGECFEEYRNGGPSTDRSRCPTCRSYHLGGSRKASRLIKNMCSDIHVLCPNEGCQITMARGCVEQHATKECPEQELSCPDTKCTQKTKRKNFVREQCIHNTHIECDCGATIRLGRGEWIKHKDKECPNAMNLHSDSGAVTASHSRTASTQVEACPGTEYGCTEDITPEDLPGHTESCPFARLAPYFKKQSTLLQSLSEQLKMTKIRNEVLETGFERLNEFITNTVQPRLDSLTAADPDDASDVEEIERHDLPRIDHDLSVLPAHLRELTPSPSFINQSHALYNDLNPRLTQLETHVANLESRLTDLDARSSMALMNETLRIREELAHINGAMYSTRAQVQWLLNRERIIGQRDTMAAGGVGMRGRVGAPSTGQHGTSATGPATAGHGDASANSQPASGAPRPSMDRNMSSAWSNVSQSAGRSGSGPNSGATSPMFSATGPSLRRSSGGSSQERVKL